MENATISMPLIEFKKVEDDAIIGKRTKSLMESKRKEISHLKNLDPPIYEEEKINAEIENCQNHIDLLEYILRYK